MYCFSKFLKHEGLKQLHLAMHRTYRAIGLLLGYCWNYLGRVVCRYGQEWQRQSFRVQQLGLVLVSDV